MGSIDVASASPGQAVPDVAAVPSPGDEATFLELVRSWSPRVRAVAERLAPQRLADRTSAVDRLVVGAWTRSLSRLGGAPEPAHVRATVLRGLVDEARARRLLTSAPAGYRRPPGPAPEDPAWFLPPDDADWPGHWACPPQPWPGSDDEGGDPAVAAGLAAAVDRLPEPQRVVLGLRDTGGCSTEEVARLLGIDRAQVTRLLSRARTSVRRSLDAAVHHGSVRTARS